MPHFRSPLAACWSFSASRSSSAAAQALQRANTAARASAAHLFASISNDLCFCALLGAHVSSPAWVADSPIRAGAGVCPQEVM